MPAKKDPFAVPQVPKMARTGTFQPITASPVSTQSPFTGSQMRQYATTTPSHYGFGQSSGDKSRQAFAQAATMQRQNQTTAAMDALSRQYRSQQEKSRAADIASQRADQVRRYGMDEDYLGKRRQQDIRRQQQIADYATQVRNAQRAKDASIVGDVAQLGFSSFMPAFGATLLDQAERTRGVGNTMFNPNTFRGSYMSNLRDSLFY